MAEKIKRECITLLSNKAVLSKNSMDFLSEYRGLYNYKQVLTVLHDEELVFTAKTFLENNLNITSASKQGYMHRNTLIYRIEKIKKLIGLDIKNFKEAVVFENLVMIYEMLKVK